MKDKLGRFLMHWRIRAVLPHIRGYLLDIGCGTNELARAYGGHALGVDVFQWGNVDLVVDNSATLPLADQTFDTVTIVAALNHIPDRYAVVSEAYRLLKFDGRIVITMIPPRVARIWHRLRAPWDADQLERGMEEGEVYGLHREVVDDILTSCGFELEGRKRFMLGFNCLTTGRKPSGGRR